MLVAYFFAACLAAAWIYRRLSSTVTTTVTSNRLEDSPSITTTSNNTQSNVASTVNTRSDPEPSKQIPTSKDLINQIYNEDLIITPSTTLDTPILPPTTPDTTPSTPIFTLKEEEPVNVPLASDPIPVPPSSPRSLEIRYGVHEIQGKRKEMEDAHYHEITTEGGTTVAFFGVYDGHGGRRAADFAATKLHAILKNHPEYLNNTKEALKFSFAKTESEFMEMAYKDQLEDGSTAVVALIVGNNLFIGNVGDSEAILCRAGKPICLSTLHNPSKNPAEVQRVQEVGGRLYYNRVGHPVINPVLFNIAVSRAIGDIMYKHEEWTSGKKSGLIAEPDITTTTITPEDEFLILACDGLWDVFSYQSAIDFVKEKLRETNDPQEICIQLVREAERRDTLDNVTVCLVLFSFCT